MRGCSFDQESVVHRHRAFMKEKGATDEFTISEAV